MRVFTVGSVMRILALTTFVVAAIISTGLSAQDQRRPRSPEREAQREVCRQEARKIHRVRSRSANHGEEVRARVKGDRKAYIRDCMQRTRPSSF
jgi:hypothetical protein